MNTQNSLKRFFAITTVVLGSIQAQANFTYEGNLADPSGIPVQASNVIFQIAILSPGPEACVLYSESHTQNMTGSEGYFSLNIGGGTPTFNTYSFQRVFQNFGTMSGLTCATGTSYAPATGDVRKLKVLLNVAGVPEDMGTLVINAVPFAETSRSVGAFESQHLLRAVDAGGNPVTAPSLTPPLVTELTNLLAGTSTKYLGSDATQGSKIPVLSSAPSTPVPGSFWYDSTTNTMKYYNGSSNISLAAAGSSVSFVTATAPLTVTNGSTTPSLSLPQASSSTHGYLSSTDWISFNTKLSNGTTFAGDVTGSFNTLTIANNVINSPKIVDSSIKSMDLDFTGMNSPNTDFVMRDSSGKFFGFICSSMGQVPTWTASGFQCLTPQDPRIGSNVTNSLSKWNGSSLVASSIHENTGNIGIGTATPRVQLEVVSTTGIGGQWNNSAIFQSSPTPGANSGSLILRTFKDGGVPSNRKSAIQSADSDSATTIPTGAWTDLLLQPDGGNVGLGTSSPAYKLDVYGAINIATSYSLYFGGTAVCSSTGCTSSSDRSLKENIQPLQGSLEKVLQLQGVEYDYKDKKKFTSRHQIGVIAQDVEKLFPEVVIKDPKTGLRAVAYDHLVAPLIESFKTLYHQVVELENTLSEIKAENAQLKQDNDSKSRELAEVKARLDKIEAALSAK